MLLGTFLKKIENIYSQRHTHPYVHCSIFTVARTWKPAKCALRDDWIKKMWHIHTMGYCSAKKDEIRPIATT